MSHPQGGEIVAEADLRPSRAARLCAKLLLFDKPPALRRFWVRALGLGELGSGCVGAVNGLRRIHERGAECWVECDPRYFCLIGLTLTHLSMEVIAHESVHAGLCWVKRRGQDPMADEECLAYPAGHLAAEINRFLYSRDLYPRMHRL